MADALAAMRGNEDLLETLNTLFLVDARGAADGGGAPGAPVCRGRAATPLQRSGAETLIQVSGGREAGPRHRLFDKYNLLALPVIDEDGKLAGVITADDIISVLREK